MTYKDIIGITPAMMSIGLVGEGVKSVGKGFGGMIGLGVKSMVGIPLIGSVSNIIKGL
jgi:hypothetical protein